MEQIFKNPRGAEEWEPDLETECDQGSQNPEGRGRAESQAAHPVLLYQD